MEEILLSFVGNRDPYREADDGEEPEHGPVLSLLGARRFDRALLFCTGPEYVERARTVAKVASEEGLPTRFNYAQIDLSSPIDYEEIYRELTHALDAALARGDHRERRLSVLLDPGTPQMQTAWFLLVAGGRLQADLLQGVPPKFAGGAYKVHTVDLTRDLFPGVAISSTRQGPRSVQAAGTAPPHWARGSGPTAVGRSAAFEHVLTQAHQVAQYDVTILLRGETGTGKEVIARLIHEHGRRSGGPLVAVNCAAISAGLTESELFGHTKGAFTGADHERLGQIRAADGGTLLLDEVGDLPLETQAKLLRVLEERCVTPLGADSPVDVDVRLVAATNRDLEEQIEAGGFRRDLYERIAGVTVEIPPLRGRPEDIDLLLEHFLREWNQRYGEAKGFGQDTVRHLREYPWPGNVRELKNAVASLCAMGHGASIGPELLPASVARHFTEAQGEQPIRAELPADGLELKAVLHNIERGYFEQALERAGGNAEQAAKLLGLQGPAFRKAARERFGIAWRAQTEEGA